MSDRMMAHSFERIAPPRVQSKITLTLSSGQSDRKSGGVCAMITQNENVIRRDQRTFRCGFTRARRGREKGKRRRIGFRLELGVVAPVRVSLVPSRALPSALFLNNFAARVITFAMKIKTLRAEFKKFGESETVVNFGDSADPHLLLPKPPEIRGAYVALFEGDKDSPCLTAKQLFNHLKSLQGCDELELVVIPTAGAGAYPVENVSKRPINGVIFLDCNTDTLR